VPAISFTPLAREHLPLLHDWLNREHVRRWWHRSHTLEEVAAKYVPRIEGSELARVFLIELEARPVGMIQTYFAADHPEWIGPEPGVAGVDLFIAEEDLLGQGLGPRILIEFMRDVVFADPATTACAASPEVVNLASIRAFEKAGFARVREIPGEHGPELLLRVERQAVLSGHVEAPARRTI
jgi:RimJ/RimL family protein N-acetyltransferase